MRMIDADALKETIASNVYPVADAFNSRDYGMFWTGGIEKAIDDQPAIEPEPHYDEWCTDCKEYDHERHCCPRWNRVIRETLKDAQPEIIRCRDCKYWREHKYAKETKRYIQFCGFNAIYTKADDFCSRAERRTE